MPGTPSAADKEGRVITRTAHIQKHGSTTRETVEAYLPDNYAVTDETATEIVICGEDAAGWTLDGYVIPRLASGNIVAVESPFGPTGFQTVEAREVEVKDLTSDERYPDTFVREVTYDAAGNRYFIEGVGPDNKSSLIVLGANERIRVWREPEREPAVPESEYTLRDYRSQPEGGLYVAADRSPWQLRVEERDEGDCLLHLILGDSAYHEIPAWDVTVHGARKTAELYDETGAADDIEQILLAAARLLDLRTGEPFEEDEPSIGSGDNLDVYDPARRVIVVEFNGSKGWEIESEHSDEGPGSAGRIAATAALQRVLDEGLDGRLTFQSEPTPDEVWHGGHEQRDEDDGWSPSTGWDAQQHGYVVKRDALGWRSYGSRATGRTGIRKPGTFVFDAEPSVPENWTAPNGLSWNRVVPENETVTVEISRKFYEDHLGRDLPGGIVLKALTSKVRVVLDREALRDIRSDADYFAGFEGEDFNFNRGVVLAARAVLRQLKGVEIPGQEEAA